MNEIRGMKVEIRGNDLVFTRRFKAPRELVYKAWTDAEYLAQWFGPHGFFCPQCSVDLRPGGEFRITMQGPDGELHRMDYRILEMVKNEKLVIVNDLSDISDAILRKEDQSHDTVSDTGGFERQWTVTFEDDAAGTRMTLVTHSYTAEDREAKLKRGDDEGWAMIMEKMDSVLTRMLHQKHL